MKKNNVVNIIGAGLAGSEAAYQLAKRGVNVRLYEMRPTKQTEVHETDLFAELVCSNSLRSNDINNAVGLLKEEMRMLDSLIMKAAEDNALPAGSALAVDRKKFSQQITDTIQSFENVTVINEEVKEILDGPTIIASGPLTSSALGKSVAEFFGEEYFYFFDAVAPIIEKDSINLDVAYYKSRYDKGTADYLNCAMDREQFFNFYQELMNAELVKDTSYEDESFFDGCMPVEQIAKQGMKTLLHGPMKPVGLEKDGERPYAVVQLRQDNFADSLYNIVGFQTRMTWPEQKRVIRMIPGLENAEIVRYGVMHRNAYINSPKIMNPTLQTKKRDDLMIAGQFSGVEGYVESAAMGLLAGINMAKFIFEEPLLELDNDCMIGSLANYICFANPQHFQPMNANFGIIKATDHYPKKERRQCLVKQSLAVIESVKDYV